jgi:hypothetical protein
MSKQISVIIVDNARKYFIKDAILSTLNQSLSRDQYEILVVLNYYNKNLEESFANQGIQFININVTKGGELYAKGIKESNGEIIVFLDDDDMFDYHKLKHINYVFQQYKELGYYHHIVKIIDERGNLVSNDEKNPYIKFANKNFFLNDKLYAHTQTEKYQMINKATCGRPLKDPFMNLAFNSSSIAMRRDLVFKYLDALSRMHFAQDHLHFLEALMSDYAIMHEPLSLTYYRIHSSNFVSQNIIQLGAKSYEQYSIIKSIGGKYLKKFGVDLNMCGTAYWKPIIYYAISKRDIGLVLTSTFFAFKKILKSRFYFINKLFYKKDLCL